MYHNDYNRRARDESAANPADHFDMEEIMDFRDKKSIEWKKIVSVLASLVLVSSSYAVIQPSAALGAETASTQESAEIAAEKEVSAENESAAVNETEAEAETAEKEDPGQEVISDGGSEDDLSEETAEEEERNEEESAEAESDSDGAAASDAEAASTQQAAEPTEKENGDSADAAYGTTEEAAGTADQDLNEQELIEETDETAPLITESTRLVFEAQDYVFYADVDAAAMLPVGTELRVRALAREDDPDAYEAFSAEAMKKLTEQYGNETALSFEHYYEVSFAAGEQEVQPAAKVKITVEYREPLAVSEETKIDAVYFDPLNEAKAEVLASTVNDGAAGAREDLRTIAFESDGVYVFGIVGTTAVAEEKEPLRELKAAGDGYEVTVTSALEAGFPKDAELKVEEIEAGTPAYEEYKALAQEAAGAGQPADKVEYARFFDIRILSGGEEITPDGSVKVDIRLTDTDVQNGDLSYKAVKIEEDTVTELEAEIGEGISFGTDGL